MEYKLSKKYETPELMAMMMGPNPVKLTEELMAEHELPKGAEVCDLGSGQGLTSAFLAKEYGFKVTAADLWSEPEEHIPFFESMGLSAEQITPVKADALNLPFEKEGFDAVVSVDSYNYFGRDPRYLDEKLLPFIKKGGLVYAVVPGMKKDLHDNLPPELLLFWKPEDLEYIHDLAWWRKLLEQSKDAEILSIKETEGNEELWQDWIRQDNEYAAGDRKVIEAGGGKYLNFIAFVLCKK